MAFILSDRAGVKYSPGEKRLFALLPSDSTPVTSERLTAERYRGNSVPFNARKITIGLLSSLSRKIDRNKEPFKLIKGPRAGPHSIELWLEKRAK